MAIEEKDISRLGSHIKLIYCLIIILFLITTSGFIVNFLYILEIREDLSLKCSCSDGEKLLSLELRIEGTEDAEEDTATPPRDSQRGGDVQHKLNKGESEEDVLIDGSITERDRRKIAKTRDDSIFYRNDIIEGYAKLPVTISVDSILDFCNATFNRCPAGRPGVKGEPGSAGLPGRPGPRGPHGASGASRGAGLSGPKGDRGPPGHKGDRGSSIPGTKGDKGDRGDLGTADPCTSCQQSLKDKWRETLTDDEDADGAGSGGDDEIFKTLMSLYGANPTATGAPGGGWFPLRIPGPPGPPGEAGPKGDPGESGSDGMPGRLVIAETPPCCNGHLVTGDPGESGSDGMPGRLVIAETPPCCNVTSPEALLEALSKLPESRIHQFRGPPGALGPPGPAGLKGMTGIAGQPGLPGLKGTPGQRGQRGPKGMKGNRGQRGRTGPGGPRGLPGRAAELVERWSEGTASPSDPSGTPQTITIVEQGSPGPPGPPGKDGAPGLPGPPGPPGPSSPQAPSIQRDTELSGYGEDWIPDYAKLNLMCMESCNTSEEVTFVIGPPGPRGPAGKRGPKGFSADRRFIIGPPGQAGSVGPKGDPGSQGLKGERGVKGQRGEIGLSGRTGDRGEKGSYGDPGLDGMNGMPGSQGPTGEKGDKGDAGLNGVPGFLHGPMGPAGPPGKDGVPGIPGVHGLKGDIGSTGKRGEKGEQGPPGPKGQKGMKGYCIGLEPIPSDSNATPETSEWLILETKPPPFEREKECKLRLIEGPFEQARSRAYLGAWMRDVAPDAINQEKIWVTNEFVGNKLLEYANLNTARIGLYSREIILPHYWDGSGHIVYRNSFYHHVSGTQRAARFDLETNTIAADAIIPDSRYENTAKHLYKSKSTFFDFAVDENGLWIVYTMSEGMLVVSNVNATDLSIIRTIRTNRLKSSSGDAFIICGVLYATKSTYDVYSGVDYVFDLYTNEELTPIDIPIVNRYRASSMLAYYPYDRFVYGYDKGFMMLYNVTLQSDDG